MSDKELLSLGYQLEPTRYSPRLGYSRLRTVISGQPEQRYFDVKLLRLPTFDGRFYHQTQITRHELSLKETYQVCIGRFNLENYQGDEIHGFSFGGVLKTKVVEGALNCDFTSSAPIFKQRDLPGSVGSLLVDEIMELLAEKQISLPHHEDDLYSRLAKSEPYELFLSCLVTLQKRFDSVPANLQRAGNFRKTYSELQKVIQIVRVTDGWDGRSPTLDELISLNNR
jgi:hypothetical protein